MGKRRSARVSEEHVEEEDEEMSEEEEFDNGSSSSDGKSLYEVYYTYTCVCACILCFVGSVWILWFVLYYWCSG